MLLTRTSRLTMRLLTPSADILWLREPRSRALTVLIVRLSCLSDIGCPL